MSEDEAVQAVLKAMGNYLAQRERCESEVRIYIQRKGLCIGKLTEKVIATLKTKGFINDYRFAENRVVYRRNHGYGPFYIKNELQVLQLSPQVLEQLEPEFNNDLFFDPAVRLLERKFFQKGAPYQGRHKMQRFLHSRGFTGATIKAAVKDVEKRHPEWRKEIERSWLEKAEKVRAEVEEKMK